MKVLTGEQDADASDPTAFDDVDLDTPATTPASAAKAPASAAEAPSPETPTPTPPETESAPTPRSPQPETSKTPPETSTAEIIDLKTRRVIVTENPDWSLVAKAFEGFIPADVCF